MEEVQKILRHFSTYRDMYPVEVAIEHVANDTGIDQQEVLDVLSGAGLYILPDSEEEQQIRRFIDSAHRAKPTVNELSRAVAWNFCISNKEAARLAHKWFNYSEDIA